MSDSVISQVKSYMGKERGNALKLSEKLGYKSVQTIYAWRKTGKIPEKAMKEVKAALAVLKKG